jgi:DUF4097 and DUF4098 domain-containing protein YvlB
MKRKWLIASVFIIIELVLCAGIVLVSWAGASQLRTTGVRWRILQFDTISAETREEQRFTVGDSAALVVENPRGQVTVTGGPGNEIMIQAHKMAWGPSEPEAQAALALLKVNVAQDRNMIRVQVEEPSVIVFAGFARSGSVDLAIAVPITTAVTTRADLSAVTLSNTIGDADVQTSRGTLRVTGVSGRLSLRSDFGDITVERATAGTVQAYSNRGAVSLTNVQAEGSVSLTSDFGAIGFKGGRADSLTVIPGRGEVTLADLTVRRTATIRSDFGELTIEKVTAGAIEAHSSRGAVSLTDVQVEGAVNLESDFGAIQFKTGRADSLTVKANRGEIKLIGLTMRGQAMARSDFGSVMVEQVQAAFYDLYAGRGVGVKGASGALKAHSDFGNVDVENGDQVNLDLRTDRGQVTFAGSLGQGPHTLNSSFGDVRLRLPSNTALTFEFETNRGQIKSDFPVTISGDLGQTHWSGTINGGGARLTVSTDSGNILLNTLEP